MPLKVQSWSRSGGDCCARAGMTGTANAAASNAHNTRIERGIIRSPSHDQAMLDRQMEPHRRAARQRDRGMKLKLEPLGPDRDDAFEQIADIDHRLDVASEVIARAVGAIADQGH